MGGNFLIELLFTLSVLPCLTYGGNLALRQPTAISSNYSADTSPNKAVDGNPRRNHPYGAETKILNADAWWRVDLGRSYVIDDVNILSRNDSCCWESNNGAVITVGDNIDGTLNKLCRVITGVPQQTSFKCLSPLRGRYLTIYKKYISGIGIQVALYEVMVNENPTDNLAKGKQTAQSSSRSGIKNSFKAVDGNREGDYHLDSCTHTVKDTLNPWWRVDLGSSYPVSEVFIVNRDRGRGRLVNIEIHVGDSLDNNGNSNPQCGGMYSMATLFKASFYCKPRKTGRYVNIRLVGNTMTLTLCEVEVYSESKAIMPYRPANTAITLIQRLPPQLTCPESFGFPVPYISLFHGGVMVYNTTDQHITMSESMMHNRRDDSVWEYVVSNKHGSDFFQFNVEGSYKMCAKYQDLTVTAWSINTQSSTYSNTNAVINSDTWYRLTDGQRYLQLPESCVSPNHCSTQATGWMVGPHPAKQDLISKRTVCFSWQGNCCYHNTTVLVRRCHGYYVYKLKRVTLAVHAGYCTVISTLNDPSIMFHSEPRDHVLVNHVINTEQGLTLIECISVCLSDNTCLSINHDTNTQLCEMNNSTKYQSRVQDWTERSGNQYHEFMQGVLENIEL